MNLLHRLVNAGVIAFAVFVCPEPPPQLSCSINNYAPDVLTAARALQQINNRSCRCRTGADADQPGEDCHGCRSRRCCSWNSRSRYPAVLAQAQRIAYDIQQIDRAFSTTYAPASSSIPDQALMANAQSRWQNAMAGLQDACGRRPRSLATSIPTVPRCRPVTSSQGRDRCVAGKPGGNQLLALQAQQLRDLTAVVAATGARKTSSRPACVRSGPGREQLRRFLRKASLSTHNRADVSLDEREKTETAPDRGSRGAHRPRSCRLRHPVT